MAAIGLDKGYLMFRFSSALRPPWWKRALLHLSMLGFGASIFYMAARDSGLDVYVADKAEAAAAGTMVVVSAVAEQEEGRGKALGGEPALPKEVPGACAKPRPGQDGLVAAVRCLEEVISLGEREAARRKENEKASEGRQNASMPGCKGNSPCTESSR